ncbi:hypothetical protein [Streptomyces sp. AM 4-1-1]|uniref:BACON domain-containing protein n=1 Tax=Streptomyces sp. AM 4-1-1 TaxID=3028710 RepID=UPI0031B9EA4B
MTSSRLETPRQNTGTHRTHDRAPLSSVKRPPTRYEPYLDGLFTYCLSVLCDHETATDALGAVLAVAQRQSGRCPADEQERKAWLYALARWTCLRTLTERRPGHPPHGHRPNRRTPGGARTGGRTPPAATVDGPETAAALVRAPGSPHPPATSPGHGPVTSPGTGTGPSTAPATEARRRELARLAWPEAAGTTPEQREALELAVRHGLPPHSVAAVLGLEPPAARELLAAAACEVERTRAALAVVESGACPTVALLAGGHRMLLSAALRRELVRHVDDCPHCRRAAERAGAAGPWPGTPAGPAASLPLVEAPRPSAYVAMAHALRNRSATPRFARTGFPLAARDHAARRTRVRTRVVTTTVVATVVAAPVIALWAAYRGAPVTGEGHGGSSVVATERVGTPETDGGPHGRDGNGGGPGRDHDDGLTGPASASDISAEVISAGAPPQGADGLTVVARSSRDRTTIVLTAYGSAPVLWSAWADAPWLRLSRSSGTLAIGESVRIGVTVDHRHEPRGPWSARVGIGPSGAVVAIHGRGVIVDPSAPGEPEDPPGSAGPSPSDPGPRPSTGPSDPPGHPTTPPEPGGSTDPDPTGPTPPDPTTPTPTPTADPGTPTANPAPREQPAGGRHRRR